MAELKEFYEPTFELLQKYSQMLNDTPESRVVLAQDTAVASFLLDTLADFKELKMVRMALEIIAELISCDGNKTKAVLRSDPKFKETLDQFMEKFKSDVNIGFICESIIEQVFPDQRATVKPATTTVSNRTRLPRFLGSTSRQQLKTLIFQSEDFSDSDVKRTIEQCLVKVKGVVSIYFEATTSGKIWRCIVRVWTTIGPEVIANTILATERVSSLHHVGKDEYGDEILTHYGSDGGGDNKKVRPIEKSTLPLPSYLDENDDLIFGVVIGDRALTKFGEKESNKGGGWLSGVSSFFSKTLYW